MSLLPDADLATRRKALAAQISLQRGELADSFQNLGKPIHYAEYGLRSFGFLRKNTWVFMAVPAFFNVASTLLGMGGKKRSKGWSGQKQGIEEKPKGLFKHAARWGGYGWRAFQLYRKFRPFLLP